MLTRNYTPLNIHRFDNPKTQPIANGSNIFQTAFFILLFAISLGLTGFFFYQYRISQQQLSQATVDNTEFILKKVARLTLIPKDEKPSIASVSSKDQLPDQAFFRNAEIGDKLIVFTKSKKAILYRPSLDRIVEVTSVDFNSDVGGASTQKLTDPESTSSDQINSKQPTLFPTTTKLTTSPSPTSVSLE